MRVRQPIRRLLRSWCRELGAERGRGLTQTQTLGVVTHVHLFPVEDRLELLREGRVETHPRHEGCEYKTRTRYSFITISAAAKGCANITNTRQAEGEGVCACHTECIAKPQLPDALNELIVRMI